MLERQPQRVGLHVLLDRRSHVRRRLEEAVRGREPLDTLVRALEIVGVDVEPQPPVAIGVVAEDRARQELLPERLPETLHFAQRLGVLWAALDVPDTLTPELLLEVGLAAPCRVLPALVRQDLLGR
ncbi:MAG TPA: hypothetical protein VK672_02560, partial [Solirubrobacteraceae bacterium]|nr:hypothetical protein [Solirubrobacteraceae bacterium]